MTTEPRFYVHDRGATVARELWRFSAVNPRYGIIDRTTGQAIDDASTKRAASMAASTYNENPGLVPNGEGLKVGTGPEHTTGTECAACPTSAEWCKHHCYGCGVPFTSIEHEGPTPDCICDPDGAEYATT